MADQARLLQKRLKPYRRLQLRLRNRIAGSLKEHQAIVDAILAGNGDRAEEMLKDHVPVQGERLSDFVATLDPSLGAHPIASCARATPIIRRLEQSCWGW
ncbi:MAG: FCD domain-containing protein [Rhodospirillales bacterium]|nr:FCD domain-containing protein [Rhodospirillales bacterium]